MVARRVAEERSAEVGGEVGYAVRFEERTSRSTRIKYLTGAAGRGSWRRMALLWLAACPGVASARIMSGGDCACRLCGG